MSFKLMIYVIDKKVILSYKNSFHQIINFRRILNICLQIPKDFQKCNKAKFVRTVYCIFYNWNSQQTLFCISTQRDRTTDMKMHFPKWFLNQINLNMLYLFSDYVLLRLFVLVIINCILVEVINQHWPRSQNVEVGSFLGLVEIFISPSHHWLHIGLELSMWVIIWSL